MRTFAAAIALSLVPALLRAQSVAEATFPSALPDFVASNFFTALLVGLALGLAFQLILTNLSIAVGISAIGDLASAKAGISAEGRPSGPVRRVETALGIWALATAGISLFAACWLAVKVSLAASTVTAVVLGLSIWGLYYLAMTALEASAARFLVGSIFSAASAGLRSLRRAASATFSAATEARAAESARQITASVREELLGASDARGFRDELRRFIQEIKPKSIDPQAIREELVKLFDQVEIRAMSTQEGRLDWDRLVAAVYGKYGHEPAEERRKKAFSILKEEAGSKKSVVDRVVDTGLRLAGMSKDRAESIRHEWEDYLRNTGKQELNPDNIKRELELLITDPKAGKEALKTRASEIFGKSTITTLLAERKDMTYDEAERTVHWVDDILREIRTKQEGAKRSLDAVRRQSLARVRDYLDSLNRPELKYEGLKQDVLRLFQDPKAGADALLHRLKAMDRDTLRALLASRPNTTPEEADHLLQQIESARNQAQEKVLHMKAELERRLSDVKEKGLRQLEDGRKAVASAAWWAFAAALGSACAAVGGALAAI